MSGLRWQGWPGAVVLCAAGLLTFGNVFGNGWHYDDAHAITENPHLRSLADPWRFVSDPAQSSRDADKGMFRPLLVLSYALNYAWGGLDTVGWHVVNLGLHLACGLLLWRLLLGLGRAPGTALVGALIFTLHPLVTEPVNYISSRSESLSAAFVLGALWLHLRARQAAGAGWRAGSVVCYGLGMLAKSVAIVTPVLLLAHDGLRDGWRRACAPRRLAPYALVAVGYLAVVGPHLTRAVATEAVRGPWAQLLTQAKALPYYAKLLVFPVGLNVHHQFFEGGTAIVVLLSLAAVASLAFWTLRGAPRDVVLGLAWGGVVLAPTLIVPLNVLVNDHRLYLPLAGVVVAVTALTSRLWRGNVIAVGLAVVVALGVRAHQRNRVWVDDYALWTDAAAKSPHPQDPVAEVNLGNAARAAGRPGEAIDHFRRALQIAPGHVPARNNLGLALQQQGRLDEAIEVYEGIVRDEPAVAEGWYNLGKAYQARAAARGAEDRAAALADLERARQAYGHVRADSPHRHVALNNLGTVFELAGRLDSAVAYYRRSLTLQPSFVDARRNLERLAGELPARAQALLAAGKAGQLESLCRQLLALAPAAGAPLQGHGSGGGDALRLSPSAERDARFFLAVGLLYQGRYDESLEVNRRLLEAYPDFEEAYLQLGNLYETMGEPTRARQTYRAQLARRPDGQLAAEARRRLAALPPVEGETSP